MNLFITVNARSGFKLKGSQQLDIRYLADYHALTLQYPANERRRRNEVHL